MTDMTDKKIHSPIKSRNHICLRLASIKLSILVNVSSFWLTVFFREMCCIYLYRWIDPVFYLRVSIKLQENEKKWWSGNDQVWVSQY